MSAFDEAVLAADTTIDNEASTTGLWSVGGESLGIFVGFHEFADGLVDAEQTRLTFSPLLSSIPAGVDVADPALRVTIKGQEYRITHREYEPEPALRVHLRLAKP